ncbi:60bd37af-2f45-4256-9954-3de067f1fd9b [Thermothielavioides terrestris]|uniref:60bd37af-2f45-4256-9954-3de067f1fd9b n=1 Tax=Thermothielavioides terrestris TaxID=2587410 RepID=A0A3S4F2D4_9PEZI|nr:60bd37af-2f45-4256-9954-3de067f1fd9b [Thermothielavioides terrestris]
MPPPLPPLPFPYPLRIGTDICRIGRIQRILQSARGPRFIQRVLAPEELAHTRPAVRAVLDAAAAAARSNSSNGNSNSSVGTRTQASTVEWRWAAKEAAFKAHAHLRLGFHDVLILTPSETEAEIVKPEAAWPRAPAPVAVIKPGDGRRDQMAMVSISHDGQYATAVCIGFDAGQDDGERNTASD